MTDTNLDDNCASIPHDMESDKSFQYDNGSAPTDTLPPAGWKSLELPLFYFN